MKKNLLAFAFTIFTLATPTKSEAIWLISKQQPSRVETSVKKAKEVCRSRFFISLCSFGAGALGMFLLKKYQEKKSAAEENKYEE